MEILPARARFKAPTAWMKRHAGSKTMGAMVCPACGTKHSTITDSRPSENNTAVRRRRACFDCGLRWTTKERTVSADEDLYAGSYFMTIYRKLKATDQALVASLIERLTSVGTEDDDRDAGPGTTTADEPADYS